MDTYAPAPERVFRLAVAPIAGIVVRDSNETGDGSWTMEGYAAVYEQSTVLYDGRWFRISEEIAVGAFTNVLARVAAGEELVHFNFGHEMNSSIAATDVEGIGGLELSENTHGLRYFARVDPEDPDAVRLAAKMRRGVVRQASFAFTVAEEELTVREGADGKEEDHYRILEIGHLYDVCACPQGAYPQTESHLRSLAAASLGRVGFDPAGLDRRAGATPAGVADVAPEVPEGGGASRSLELAQLKARTGDSYRNLTRRFQ